MLQADDVKKMDTYPIVFALANPEPVDPEKAGEYTGDSKADFQIIRTKLTTCFPGIFRSAPGNRLDQ